MLDLGGDRPGVSDGLSGDTDRIEGVEFVDQNPIGKSSRSNPATYVKAWDDVRSLLPHSPWPAAEDTGRPCSASTPAADVARPAKAKAACPSACSSWPT